MEMSSTFVFLPVQNTKRFTKILNGKLSGRSFCASRMPAKKLVNNVKNTGCLPYLHLKMHSYTKDLFLPKFSMSTLPGTEFRVPRQSSTAFMVKQHTSYGGAARLIWWTSTAFMVEQQGLYGGAAWLTWLTLKFGM